MDKEKIRYTLQFFLIKVNRLISEADGYWLPPFHGVTYDNVKRKRSLSKRAVTARRGVEINGQDGFAMCLVELTGNHIYIYKYLLLPYCQTVNKQSVGSNCPKATRFGQ